jgi:hypothetical protein
VKEVERGHQGHTFGSLLHQSSTWHRAVSMYCFYKTSCFTLSAKDWSIEQRICNKFCVKLCKSLKYLGRLLWTFVKLDSGFWMAFTFQGRSSVSWRCWTCRATKHQQMDRKFSTNSRIHPRRPSPSNVRSRRHRRAQLWSLPWDLNNKFEHAPLYFLITTSPPTCPWKPQISWLKTTMLSFSILSSRWTYKRMVRSDRSKPALIFFFLLQEYTQQNPLSKF